MSAYYTKTHRLADVLALLQVLSIDEQPYRTEDGLREELQGDPKSAKVWFQVAREHPEFFRVNEVKNTASLLARHATPKEDGKKTLEMDFIRTLMQTAVDMHDREAVRTERAFQLFRTVLGGIVGGFLTVAGQWAIHHFHWQNMAGR